MKSREIYIRQHFELFDIVLIKFHKQAIPKMFSTKTYKKVLPTPLCFRDFNVFLNHEMKVEKDSDLFPQGDVFTNDIKPEQFVLKTSLKHRQMRKLEDRISEKISFAETAENDRTAVEKEIHEVFNVSNERIQFDLTESEFHSVHLIFKLPLAESSENVKHPVPDARRVLINATRFKYQ